MSGLRSVVRHEYLTVVKQKGFWAYMITVPAIFLLIFLLIGFAGRSDNASLEKIASDLKGVAVVDASGLVSQEIIAASGQKSHPVSQLDTLRQAVEDGDQKGLIYYPQDILQTRQFEVHISGVDFVFSTSVSQVG